jgi:hypothetical protein
VERTLSVASPGRRRATRRAVTTAVAALAVFGAEDLVAQADTVRPPRTTVSREVIIPFLVGPPNCPDRTRRYAVTMVIYNVLAQPVSIPTLVPDIGSDPHPPGTTGRPLSRLVLPCGRYAALWNGRHMTTGRRLAPGVYLFDLVIDGQRITRKVTLER